MVSHLCGIPFCQKLSVEPSEKPAFCHPFILCFCILEEFSVQNYSNGRLLNYIFGLGSMHYLNHIALRKAKIVYLNAIRLKLIVKESLSLLVCIKSSELKFFFCKNWHCLCKNMFENMILLGNEQHDCGQYYQQLGQPFTTIGIKHGLSMH